MGEIRGHDFRQLMFVGIADHAVYSWKRRNFLGRALGVASGYDDLAARVLPPDAPDGRSRIVIR